MVRQAASLAADALFERFVLWPIDGEPIPNEQCIGSIDFSRYCSLEQFGVLCGFLADLILDLEQDGKDILAEQAFSFRVAGMYNRLFFSRSENIQSVYKLKDSDNLVYCITLKCIHI